MAAKEGLEEHYVLRVKDPALAARIRALTAEGAEPVADKLQLVFEGGTKGGGKLVFEGVEHPVTVLALPTITESYKTLDDVNLVKVADVGEVLVVGDVDAAEAARGEARDGVTPPMRAARERLQRRPPDVPREAVADAERKLLTILAGGAPEGFKFVDHEEVWEVVDPATGRGAWVPARR